MELGWKRQWGAEADGAGCRSGGGAAGSSSGGHRPLGQRARVVGVDEGEGECHREADGASGSGTEKDGASAGACSPWELEGEEKRGEGEDGWGPEREEGDKAWGPLVSEEEKD